jgi:hypothetical protein
MSVFDFWTTPQWILFGGVTAVGLGALGLLGLAVHAVRGWTAPATYRTTTPAPRPSLQLATERMTDADMADFEQRWRDSKARATEAWRLPVVVLDERGGTALWTHPTEVLEHLAPGAGSLATLAEVGEGCLQRVELVDPEVARWFAEAFDRPAHAPARDEAGVVDPGGVLAQFQAAIEPIMRTVKLWEIQGRGNAGVESARQALDHWRMDYPTGGWPTVPPVGGRLPVFAEV